MKSCIRARIILSIRTSWGLSAWSVALLRRTRKSLGRVSQVWVSSVALLQQKQTASWAVRVQLADQGMWPFHPPWHLLGHIWNTMSSSDPSSSRKPLKNWKGISKRPPKVIRRLENKERVRVPCLFSLNKRHLKGDPVGVFQNPNHSYRDAGSAFLMWVHSDGMTR